MIHNIVKRHVLTNNKLGTLWILPKYQHNKFVCALMHLCDYVDIFGVCQRKKIVYCILLNSRSVDYCMG